MIADHAYRLNVYTPEECAEICQLMQSHINVTIRDLPSKDAVKTSKVGMVEYGKVKEKLEKFKDIALDGNKHLFGFDLFQFTDLEYLMYNIYDVGGEYSWHIDCTRGEVRDIKATALLNVSTEPYEGGDLEVFFNSKPEPVTQFRDPGSFFIFPSWMPHRVTPVTNGQRRTITMFLQGPTFR